MMQLAATGAFGVTLSLSERNAVRALDEQATAVSVDFKAHAKGIIANMRICFSQALLR